MSMSEKIELEVSRDVIAMHLCDSCSIYKGEPDAKEGCYRRAEMTVLAMTELFLDSLPDGVIPDDEPVSFELGELGTVQTTVGTAEDKLDEVADEFNERARVCAFKYAGARILDAEFVPETVTKADILERLNTFEPEPK